MWAVWTPTSKKGGIAGVPFDSVGSLRTTLLLHTTCMRSWCNRSANCVAAYKPKTKNWCLFCVCVLLCFINPRVRKIRHEASSCPRIFSRTLRFYYSLAPGALVHPPPCGFPRSGPQILFQQLDRKKAPPPGAFSIYNVSWSRTRRKRAPLEEFVPGVSRGVLSLQVLDEGFFVWWGNIMIRNPPFFRSK